MAERIKLSLPISRKESSWLLTVAIKPPLTRLEIQLLPMNFDTWGSRVISSLDGWIGNRGNTAYRGIACSVGGEWGD